MLKILLRPLVLVPTILIVGGVVFWVVNSNKPLQYDTVRAERKDLVQEVSVTGHVEPSQSVELAFERGGKIASVNVDVGAAVAAGQVLVGLDTTELVAQLAESTAGLESSRAQLSQYQAAAAAQRAKLDELRRGTRPEELEIAQIKADNAEAALADAETNLVRVQQKADIDLNNLYTGVRDVLNDAYAKADDAVTQQTDELFNNDTSENPVLTFTTSDVQAKNDSETHRSGSTTRLAIFGNEIASLSSAQASLDVSLVSAESHLNYFLSFLNYVTSALNASLGLSATTASSYKADVNTGRTNLTSALTSVSNRRQAIALQKVTNDNAVATAEAKVSDARNALASAQAELSLKQAGSTAEQITAQAAAVAQADANIISQRALIRQAEARVQTIQSQMELSLIKAPFAGLVTKQDAKVGEIVAGNAPVVGLIASSAFELQANIPEADIAKVQIGNRARATLDAYGSTVVFGAAVAMIDPAETVIDGVPTYKVTMVFDANDDRIKSGMTANIDIETNRRTGVLALPQRVITRTNGTETVRVLRGGSVADVTVMTGLKGSDGFVEIISGISEGDTVVLSIRK